MAPASTRRGAKENPDTGYRSRFSHADESAEPGYYAVSAALLSGQFFKPRYHDYYKAFRDRKPFAKCGYSIFLYKFP